MISQVPEQLVYERPEALCPMRTGTRTAVTETGRPGMPRILRVSHTTFILSLIHI